MGLFGPSFSERTRYGKDAQQNEAVQKASELLATLAINPDEEIIVKTPVLELAEKIKAKQWSSRTVGTAFVRRCIEAHKETNCLTESNQDIFEK